MFEEEEMFVFAHQTWITKLVLVYHSHVRVNVTAHIDCVKRILELRSPRGRYISIVAIDV
jgi:hypothetical protein